MQNTHPSQGQDTPHYLKTHPHPKDPAFLHNMYYKRCVDYIFDDKDNKFPPIRSFFLFGGVLVYLANAGLNAWVAYEYLVAKEAGTDAAASYYLTATLVFIVFPVVAINVLSWGLYTWCYAMCKSETMRNYCVLESPRGGSSQKKLITLDHHKRVTPSTIEEWTNTAETVFIEPNKTNTEGDIDVTELALTARSDPSDQPDVHVEFYALDVLTTWNYVLVTLSHLLLLGYEFRVLWLFFKRKHDRYSFERYRDLSFLRLMTAFMQSAPQLVLQLYISIITKEISSVYRIITPISIVVSMLSLALAVADYVSASKDVNHYDPPPNHPETNRMSWSSYILFILWHLAMISSRGVAFALFASVYGVGLLIVLGVHYMGMVYWMYRQHAQVFTVRTHYINKSTVCAVVFDPRQHLFRNYGIEFVVAVLNTFFHFKLREVSSVDSTVTFYSIAFVENTLLVLMWYVGRDYSISVWYTSVALYWIFISFSIGLVFMALYYTVSRRNGETVGPYLERPALTSSLNWLYRHDTPR